MSEEKTEEPTPQKLEKAREEGQGPKSTELGSVLAFASVLLTVAVASGWMAERVAAIFKTALQAVSLPLDAQWLSGLAMQAFLLALTLVLPLMAAMVAGGLAGMLIQVGVRVSFKPLGPRFEALNPAAGVKRMFSMKTLLEALQMLLRAIVVGLLVWYLIRDALPMIAGVVYQEPAVVAETWWRIILRLLSVALLVFLVMAPADFAIQHWQFIKDQRMSHDEVKREHKENEGDPQIKSARRGLAQEMVNGSPTDGNAGESRAVIANPTHCAVALAWRPGMLPTVVARGEDRQAVALRERAEALGVPVFTNRSLARALVRLPPGTPIGDEFFGAVAAILRCVVRIEALAPAKARP